MHLRALCGSPGREGNASGLGHSSAWSSRETGKEGKEERQSRAEEKAGCSLTVQQQCKFTLQLTHDGVE